VARCHGGRRPAKQAALGTACFPRDVGVVGLVVVQFLRDELEQCVDGGRLRARSGWVAVFATWRYASAAGIGVSAFGLWPVDRQADDLSDAATIREREFAMRDTWT
jgi:hypothetical protein